MLQLIGLLTCEQLQKTEIILYWRYRMNTEKTFADRLKELRNIRNYTQEELGKITNISVQSIRRYEQGRLNEEPSAYNLLQLAKALDVTPEYLLIGDNNMTSYTEAIKRELKQLNDYGQISEIKFLTPENYYEDCFGIYRMEDVPVEKIRIRALDRKSVV